MQQPLRVPPSAPARVVVLASGTGSLLESLLESAVGDYPARIVAVGVDRDCRAVEVAAAASLPSYQVRLGDYPDRNGVGRGDHRLRPRRTSRTSSCLRVS